MKAKSVLYAAIGAPVVAARRMSDRLDRLREQVSKETANYTEAANKTVDGWAAEGEKVVSRISEGKVVEEISQKVDLDQAKEQVSKLRDQLEDMLATWRTSFRPERAEERVGDEPVADKPAAKSKSATKPAADKPAAKKTSATKTTKSSTAAKTSSAKPEAAKAKAS